LFNDTWAKRIRKIKRKTTTTKRKSLKTNDREKSKHEDSIFGKYSLV
jgi:hypothetical protein